MADMARICTMEHSHSHIPPINLEGVGPAICDRDHNLAAGFSVQFAPTMPANRRQAFPVRPGWSHTPSPAEDLAMSNSEE